MDNLKQTDIDEIRQIFTTVRDSKKDTIKIRHAALEFLLSHSNRDDLVAQSWVNAVLYYLASKGYEIKKKE